MEEFKPDSLETKNFKASYGWLRNFLILKRISGSGRGIPQDCQNVVPDYLQKVDNSINESNYEAHEIILINLLIVLFK